MSIKAVVFDMDGVLIDAREWHFEALNRALGLFGYTIPHDVHETRFDGLPTKTKLEMLSQETSLPRGLHEFVNRMKQIYTGQIIEEKLAPRKQHVDALLRLKQEGYKLAVASNSIRSTITKMMERSHLASFLDFYLSNEDVTQPKPSPQIYLKAMCMAGVTADECLVLEDSPFGLRAAHESGAHVLQVQSVDDVYYGAIKDRIRAIESREVKPSYRRAA
ncbi:MAG: HAD family phosphatase [Pirellulales bacterium]